MATFVPPVGIMEPLPNFSGATPLPPLPNLNYVYLPPAPLPQTLLGSTAITSYST